MRPIVAGKLALGAVIFLLLLATVGGMFYLKFVMLDRDAGAASEVRLDVIQKNGTRLFSGLLDVPEGTALDALLRAGERSGFDVEVSEFGGGAYVRSVDGVGEADGGGWVYEVYDEGGWTSPREAADVYRLGDGASLRWRFTTDPAR